MQTFFVEIEATRLAARLMGKEEVERFPQYAYCGTIYRYSTLQTLSVRQTEGIDDIEAKAASMRFGQHCGRMLRIRRYQTGIREQASVLLGQFNRPGDVQSAQLREELVAFLRRAQLQTHTVKPGFEDINAWLEAYYDTESQLDSFLTALADEAVSLAKSGGAAAFYNPADPLTAMALRGETLGARDPLKLKGGSVFDALLADICHKPDFSKPIQPQNPYRIHLDFPEQRSVDEGALEEIVRQKMVDVSGIDQPLIIQSIEMVKCYDFCLLITKTACGREGIAICGGNWQYFYPILQKKIAPYFIGKDARELEQLLEEVYVRDLNYKIQGLAYWCCVSWLEASILDILGKAKNVYAGALFGPRVNHEVSYYCASGNRNTTPLEEIEILADRITAVGAKAVKFKIGGRMSWDSDSMFGRSEELIVLARKYFGDDMIIHADGNGSYTPEKAIEYGKLLQDINAYFYEEPCRFDYLWETKTVADALQIPIAFGEQETSLRRFRWLIANRALRVLQVDVQYFGGFIRAAKAAKMAELGNILVTPHISGGIQYANVLMLASFTPNMGKYQELKVGYEETRDFFTTPLILKDGRMNIPDGKGLGMEFDRGFLAGGDRIFLCEG